MNIRKEKLKTIRETIYRCSLGAGLNAILVPRPGITKKIGILSTRFGSLDMEFIDDGRRVSTPPGVAHFLEHQLFKKEDGDLLMTFSRFGASSNAFTEYTSTTYHFTCTENFDACLGELFRLCFDPQFERGRVDNEKSIIKQEILMYEDMPDVRLSRNLLQSLYQKHAVRTDIAGTVETIQQITPDVLYQCYRNFYNPLNMTLVMAGDLDPQRAFRLAGELMKKVTLPAKKVEHVTFDEPPGVTRPDVTLPLSISRPRVMIGFKDLVKREAPEVWLRRDIETSIVLDLVFGRSGEFFNRHYQTGLIDDEFGTSYAASNTYGFTTIGAETDRVDAFRSAVLQELERAKRGKFKARDVERIKRKIAGRFLRSFDSSESAAFVMLEMEQRGTDLERVLALIKRVTPKQLLARARSHFDPANMAVSVITPKNGR